MMQLKSASIFLCGAGVLLAVACTSEPSIDKTKSAAASSAVLEIQGNREQVGFLAKVTLKANVSPRSEGWSFSWKQLFGPAVKIENSANAELSFTTTAPPSAKDSEPYQGHLMPLSAAAAGRVVFAVLATNGPATLERTVEIFPAFPQAAWPRLAANVEGYLAKNEKSLASSANSPAVSISPSSFAHLEKIKISAVDWFTVNHPGFNEEKIRGGVWLGSKDCGRYDCHPVEYRGWHQTAHSSVLKRGISGKMPTTRGRYQEYCLACHTVGYQPGARNDGFAERAQQLNWHLPSQLSANNWTVLPNSLQERANVQCENCHGPGWFYTGYGDDICSQCHDHPPQYVIVEQAKKNRMRLAHYSLKGFDDTYACKDCHLASGYLHSIRGHQSMSKPETELETRRQGVTCPVCHDPHRADCPRQLRFCGNIEIPGRTLNMGQGALCISCHNGETDVVSGTTLRPFIPGMKNKGRQGHALSDSSYHKLPNAAPHAPQFQILTGRGGKFLTLPSQMQKPPSYTHMFAPDTCVTCHYNAAKKKTAQGGHTFKLLDEPKIDAPLSCGMLVDFSPIRKSNVAQSCEQCHSGAKGLNISARGDYDGNGQVEGIVDEIAGLMKMLRLEIITAIRGLSPKEIEGKIAAGFSIAEEKLVLTDEKCQPFLTARAKPLTIPDEEILLQKAAFNFVMIARDGSAGIHNPPYVVKLLQNSIESLEQKRQAQVKHPWKRP